MASNPSKSKPSHVYSSLSIAIVMLLSGLFILVLLHSHNLTNIIRERMNIIVELHNDSEVDKVSEKIRQLNLIKESSIKFVPKSEAIETMSKNLSINFSTEENPFYDLLTFNLKADNYSTKNLEKIKSILEKEEEVISVYYEDLTITNIKKNLNKFAYILLFIAGIFVFLAIVIIRNTINLSMYADRMEIKTMELVGAKNGFIKMPYIKSGVLVGFRAFIMASILILGLLILIQIYMPLIWEVINFEYILLTLAAILILSLLIPALTANFAANKYLQKSHGALFE